ncbi:glycosyltransferase family 2 protein [uncultured Winogradskyella sp.]|uniref:glycosyltransferase family 2 protein n=1 Tax=uncultured Winogradskyella sp. TaxID=395353 RepID=UPI002605A3B7|nr:glycosyltransferase family 2 protein [uncultured Winogradskyella sp.]
MRLSVVILNYNVRYFLELCLKSVELAIANIEAEIIVVDNNSSDESCQMVKQQFPNVILIENKENSGFSKGNNIGVAKAKGKYVCILNPDTVVAEDTFIKILQYAKKKQDIGIIGCQLIDGNGVFLPESKRHVPTARIAFQKMIGYADNYYNVNLNKNDIGKTDVLVGAFMVLKREVYNYVGGFDEDYFMYGEDIDLSYKILKSGYINYYFGEASIIHFKGESTLKDKVYAKRFYEAMEIFYKKHFDKNIVFTFLVKLSTKLASKKRRSVAEIKQNDIIKTLVISNNLSDALKSKLPKPVSQTSSLSDAINNTLVVFDTNYLSYKVIIDYMKSNSSTNQNSYRILPKNSNFILGSDSSVSRGEVLRF